MLPQRPSPAAVWTDHLPDAKLSVPHNPAVLMASGMDENDMPSKQTGVIAACLCAEGPWASTVVQTAAEAGKETAEGDEVSQV